MLQFQIRFQYDNECYTSFLNIMNEYCKKKSTEEVYPKVLMILVFCFEYYNQKWDECTYFP